jgi:hypothetical protein
MDLILSVVSVILDISARPLVIRLAGSPTEMRKQMNAVIGETFTTQKSGVSGTVQEIIKNSNGSTRIRLSLANGDSRWTTVK